MEIRGSSEQAGGRGKGGPGSDAHALRTCGRCGLCSTSNEKPARAAHVDVCRDQFVFGEPPLAACTH